MSETDATRPVAEETVDPREQMKAALEAKKSSNPTATGGTTNGPKAKGGPHGQQGGKRTFRRKSGG